MYKIDQISAMVASISASTAAIDFPQLPGMVGDLLEAQRSRLENLHQANWERHAESQAERDRVEAAILQAAEHTLKPRMCRFLSTAHYAKTVDEVLVMRHAAYGLDVAPSRRTIRAALKIYMAERNGPAEIQCFNSITASTRST